MGQSWLPRQMATVTVREHIEARGYHIEFRDSDWPDGMPAASAARAVSALTALAIRAAETAGPTLVAIARADEVFTGQHRISTVSDTGLLLDPS